MTKMTKGAFGKAISGHFKMILTIPNEWNRWNGIEIDEIDKWNGNWWNRLKIDEWK